MVHFGHHRHEVCAVVVLRRVLREGATPLRLGLTCTGATGGATPVAPVQVNPTTGGAPVQVNPSQSGVLHAGLAPNPGTVLLLVHQEQHRSWIRCEFCTESVPLTGPNGGLLLTVTVRRLADSAPYLQ